MDVAKIFSDHESRWSAKERTLDEIAGGLKTPEERVDALLAPPTITWEKHEGKKATEPVERQNLLIRWARAPEWLKQRARMAEFGADRLLEMFKGHAAEWLPAKSGKSAVPDYPEPKVWELMDKKERAHWVKNQRYEQWSAAWYKARAIADVLVALCGPEVTRDILAAIPGPGFMALRAPLEERFLEIWVTADDRIRAIYPYPASKDLEMVRAIYEARQQDAAGATGHRTEQTLTHWYAAVIYRTGNANDEVKKLLLTGELPTCYSCELGALAKGTGDYDMIVPLAMHTRHGGSETPLLEMFDSLGVSEPGRRDRIAVDLLDQLSRLTNQEVVTMHFELLGRIPEDSPVFSGHVDTLSACLESTIPEVVTWAVGRLTDLTAANGDWPTVCRRISDKLWNAKPGPAKVAATALGEIGAARSDCHLAAADLLGEALAIGNALLQETVLKALLRIRAKEPKAGDTVRDRILELAESQPSRFGKLASKFKSLSQ